MDGSGIGNIILAICGVLMFSAIVYSCTNATSQSVYGSQAAYNTQITQVEPAAENLDLKAVGNLVKKAENAEEFEKLINTPEINNLDLDGDGNVDYIQVKEYGSGDKRGFSLFTELAPGDIQEIATIDIVKEGNEAVAQVQGNQNIYGSGHYYHSRFGLTDALLIGWLFSSHRPWDSPWGYGSTPGWYTRYSQSPTSVYKQRAGNVASASTFRSSSTRQISNTAASPYSGATSSKVRAPLRNPTTAQRSFQQRASSRSVAGGGFGRSSSSRSVRSSSVSRSGGFFGGK